MKIRYFQNKTKILLPAFLLAVLVIGFAPAPARAAATLNFDVNPKTDVDLAGASSKKVTLNLTANVTGVTPQICNTLDASAVPGIVFFRSEGEASPFDGIAYTIQWIDKNQADQTFTKVLQETFSANTILHFQAVVDCLTPGLISQRRNILSSKPVDVKTKGAAGGSAIATFNLDGTWTSKDSVISVPENADKVIIYLTYAAIRIKDKTPREFLQAGDILLDNGRVRGTVDSFILGVDYFGKKVLDWGCDTAFNNVCNFTFPPQKLVNPIDSPEGKYTVDVPFTQIPAASRVDGKSFGLEIIPTIRVKAQLLGGDANVDLPFPSGQITIKFVKGLAEQKGDGKPTSGNGGPANIIKNNITGSQIWGGGGIGAVLLSIVNIIIGAIIAILRWIINLLANGIFLPLLETTLKLEAGEIAGGPILTGWVLVRDIVNMLFVLFLILIGFGTMLRIESYNYKKLLVNLIMMAILVNFSLLIGRIILQLADVFQFTFISPTDGITGVRNLYQQIYTANDVITGGFTTDIGQALTATFTIFFQFIMELGVIITFAAMAIFMLIRTVALWILLVLSPLAYGLYILPQTAGLAKQWWTTFMKYALFAPILAFFLRLSFTVYDKGLLPVVGASGVNSPSMSAYLKSLGENGNVSFSQSLELSLVYVLILAFLWAGMIVARQMGIAGANTIVGLAEKGMKAPFALGAKGAWKGTKLATGFAAQKFQKRTGIELRPSEWKKKWGEYIERKIAEDRKVGMEKAEARREKGSEFLSKLGSPMDFYRTFLNPKEWKRMKKGGQPAALRDYGKASEIAADIDKSLSTSEANELRKNRVAKQNHAHELTKDLVTSDLNVNSTTTEGAENRNALIEMIKRMQDKEKELREEYRATEADVLKRQYEDIETQLAGGYSRIRFNPGNEMGSEISNYFKQLVRSLLTDVRSITSELGSKRVVADDVKNRMKVDYRNKVKEADALRAPESYEHNLERLKLESDEASKLRGIENADRLVALAHEAENSGNAHRFVAIYKKLADDYNDNELQNSYVDEDFADGRSLGSGKAGAEKLMKQVMIKKLGMTEQAAKQAIDEVAYVNEKRDHWANARLIKYKHGKLEYNTDDEQAVAVATEVGKRGPRAIAAMNRLAWGEEVQRADGTRDFELNKVGLLMAKALGPALAASNQMQHMTTSALRRLSENVGKMRSKGVSEAFIEVVAKNVGKSDLDLQKVVKTI